MSITYFFDLEKRQMLSHGGSDAPKTVDPVKLEAARAAVMVDYQQLVSHVETNRAALAAAKALLQEHLTASVTEINELRAEVSSLEKSFKTTVKAARVQRDVLRTQWETTVSADQLDVNTFTEGETEEELLADMAKLEADKAQAAAELAAAHELARTQRSELESTLDDKRDALHDVSKDMKREKKTDELAVRSAERTLKSVFQSDRKILDTEVKRYKKQGFKMNLLDLPKLPKV